MKHSRNQRLSEHLLNVDEEILTNTYEIDNEHRLMQYKTSKYGKKHLFFPSSIPHKNIAIVACLIVILGAVIGIYAILHSNNITFSLFSEDYHNPSATDPYDIVEGIDTYYEKAFTDSGVPSVYERYVSPALEEKMNAYRDANVVYLVTVTSLRTGKDFEDFKNFINNHKEYQLLLKKESSAQETYEQAAQRLATCEDDDPHQQNVLKGEAEKAKIAWEELAEQRFKKHNTLQEEFFRTLADQRLTYASTFSKINPLPISENNHTTIPISMLEDSSFMELTADALNHLSDRGGYAFCLASFEQNMLGVFIDQ